MIESLVFAAALAGPLHGPGDGIQWRRDLESGLAQAREAGKPLLVDFWAEWCTWCHKLDETTYVDPQVVRLSRSFVAVKVDVEGSPQGAQAADRYGVEEFPSIAFLTPAGRVIFILHGYQGPGQFPHTLRSVLQMAGQVMDWEATLHREPKNPEALLKLGTHLFEQDAYDESRDLLFRARQVDDPLPLADKKQIRLVLGIIQYFDHRYDESEAILKEGLALGSDEPLDARLLYVMGKNYLKWGRADDARAALQRVVKEHAGSRVAEKAREALATLEARERHRR
jgi:thiol-disulfide isomerase/thioredoxin